MVHVIIVTENCIISTLVPSLFSGGLVVALVSIWVDDHVIIFRLAAIIITTIWVTVFIKLAVIFIRYVATIIFKVNLVVWKSGLHLSSIFEFDDNIITFMRRDNASLAIHGTEASQK